MSLGRSGPLRRSRPLKGASAPIARRTPLRPGEGNLGGPRRPLRRTRLQPVSRKRLDQAPARAAVRALVIARQGGRCGAIGLIDHRCASFPGRQALEVHEVVSRGAGGDWLDPANCVALCPVAHDLVTANPALGYAVGLRRRWSHDGT